MTVTTGAFHEDGLADTADSFGGTTPERRLTIMKDSRIGSFGASALFLALFLRIATLATLASRMDGAAVFAVVLIVASLSRTAALMLLVFLPPARSDGTSYAVGQPTRDTFWLAAGLASGTALMLGTLANLPLFGIVMMLTFSTISGFAITRLAAHHIGGHTGDMGGAAQQVAEIAVMLALLTVVEP
jgi:adenosylcobinamide-GDP ribazoletransferase